MIPRRDIKLYNGLITIALNWLFENKKHKSRKKFKAELSNYFSNENIFLLGGGRQAFHLIFDNNSFERGDEVVVPNYYLPVLIPIIKSKGLVPVFCDINKKTLSPDLEDLLDKINEDTRFMVLPHMFGLTGKVQEIVKSIKKKNENILIIEDCAHAFGSEYNEKKVGTFGDFALFSFNYIKTLSTLQGGMLLVNNTEQIRKIKTDYFSNYTDLKKIKVLKHILYYYLLILTLKTPLLYILKISLKNKKLKKIIKKINNSKKKNWKREKLSPFLSFVGLKELEKFEKKQKIINEKLSLYREKIDSDFWDKKPVGFESKWSKYYLTLVLGKNAKRMNNYFFSKKIDVSVKDELMGVCSKNKKLQDSLAIYRNIVQFPLHENLKKEEIKKISDAINSLK